MLQRSRHTLNTRFRAALRTALLPLVVAAAACSHSNQPEDGAYPVEQPVLIQVKNDNYLDVNIYTVVDETQRRLGSVTGNSTGSFKTRLPGVQAQGLVLRVTTIGGQGTYTSQLLQVGNDMVVLLHVAPNLYASSSTVRDTL